MNRRDLILAGLGGLAVALPRSVARATVLSGPLLPPAPLPLPLGMPGRKPFQPLLDRARAALDRHYDAFQLRDRVALADFSVASRELRFHIVDLIGGQTSSYLVAHGKGSDPEHTGWLHRFSNDIGSLATSEGVYRTSDIYEGVHGQSMRLVGLEPANSNAEPRAIVIHGADYVGEDHIAAWGKCGRSEGCFAVAPHMLPQVLGLLGQGRMLYADKLV